MNSLFRHLTLSSGVLLALLGPGLQVYSQQPIDASTLTPYVTGLEGPRGLAFGPDGLLYVAEAGNGGTTSTVGRCAQVPAPVGPYMGGHSARISTIDEHGKRSTVVDGLPSSVAAIGDHDGASDVAFLNGDLYALLAGGGCSHGNPTLPNGIIKVNTRNKSWKYLANLSAFYAQHPSAYPDVADFEPDGTAYSLIAFKGDLFSIEPNHGELVRTTTAGESQLVADISFHFGHIVPTGLAADNGNLYVSNLGQFPVTPNWEKLITFSKDLVFFDVTPGVATKANELGGYRLAAVRAGLTAAVSLKFGPDGLIYALELSTAAATPTPGTGKVVRLNRNGQIEDVVTGLSVPTGMTFGPDGALYISNLGAAPPGAGQILRIAHLPM